MGLSLRKVVKLMDIAEISVGIILSRKQDRLRENNKYTYKAITLKSIDNNGIRDREKFQSEKGVIISELCRYPIIKLHNT